jgi:hypothetical protein
MGPIAANKPLLLFFATKFFIHQQGIIYNSPWHGFSLKGKNAYAVIKYQHHNGAAEPEKYGAGPGRPCVY